MRARWCVAVFAASLGFRAESCRLCPSGALIEDAVSHHDGRQEVRCRDIAQWLASDPDLCYSMKQHFRDKCCWKRQGKKGLIGSRPQNASVGVGHLDWDKLDKTGYLVVPNVLTEYTIKRAKTAIRTTKDSHESFQQFRQEGMLLDHDPVFIDILEAIPPEVEAKMFSILGHWIVGAYAQITLNPLPKFIFQSEDGSDEKMLSARSGGMHADYPYGGHAGCWDDCLDASLPQHPPTIQLIFMLDDFTEDNGATLILPGSHATRLNPMTKEHRDYFARNSVSAKGKAGDLMMYIGFAWHGSGVNYGRASRTAIVIQCLPYFMKPMHNHMYLFQNRVARELPQHVRDKLGLKGYAVFGHTSNIGSGLGGQPVRRASIFLWDALRYNYPGDQTCFQYMAFLLMLATIRGRPLESLVLVGFSAAGVLLGVMMTLQKFHF